MDKRKVNDLLVKIVCLIASAALWVFIINTTNPTQRMTLFNVPVQIQNADSLIAKGLILVPNQNLITRVPLEGAANDLYSINEDAVNVILDVSQRTLKPGEQDVQVTYVQPPSGVALNGSNPTVRLKVDEYLRKPVEIKKDRLVYSATQGFYVPEPQLDANYVTVSGPRSSVDLVAAVKPISEKLDISQLTREVVKLEALDSQDQIVPNVTLSESYVEVSYVPQPVKDVPVTPNWTGINPSISLTSIRANPETVRITARESVLRTITEIETEALDMAEVEAGETSRAKNLVLPAEVFVLSADNEPSEAAVEVITVTEPVITREITKNVMLSGPPLSGTPAEGGLPVTVTISGARRNLEQLNENLIIISADITQLGAGTHMVPVKVELPKDYTLVQTKPEAITVVINP